MPPGVADYSVEASDINGLQVGVPHSLPGGNSSLSLDISSLQQCMSYTVSVTATNTGGNRNASAMLCELEPFECKHLHVHHGVCV